jgi:hypothetical protein
MICPECNGVGFVRKRFLLFFTRRARCRKCLGTGEFPPPVRTAVGYGTPYRDNDDDRWPVSVARDDVTTTTDSGAREAERFDVGSGGRSGGAGASASWGDSERSDAPVIADPFASERSTASSIVAAAIADDAISSDSSSSTSGSDGSDDASNASSSDDSGTSY